MPIIDWESAESHWLLNPRLSINERLRVDEIQKNVPFLSGHVWLMTSGTTGRFKWVAISKSALIASAVAVNAHLECDSTDCWINPLPSFHVGGLGMIVRSELSSSRYVNCSDCKWDAKQFHQLLQAESGTLTALVPTQLYDLVQQRLTSPASLRAVVIGGGVLSQELYRQARTLGWKVLPSYGLTECASQVATASLEDTDLGGFPRLKLLSHIQGSIIEGAIAIKSPSLFTGYAFQTETGVQFFDPKEEGWFRTEDRGCIEGSWLEVFGRGEHFLKIGGESVNFSQLEQLLESLKLRHSVAADVALVAVPEARLGHVIHLATNSHSSVVQQLIKEYQSQVLPFEAIRKVHILPALPRTALLKLKRHELLELINSDSGSGVDLRL